MVNADPIKKVVYVQRIRDKREFGPFKSNELFEAPPEVEVQEEEDFDVEVPEPGYRGSVLGFKVKLLKCSK